jgi:hypothetical protein
MVEVLHTQDLKNPEWTSVIMGVLSLSVPQHVSLQIEDAVLDEYLRPYLVDITVELINMWNESQGIEDRWYIIEGNLWRSGPGDSIVSAVPEEVKNIPPVTGDEDLIGYDEEYIKRLIDSTEEEGIA